ncbi:DoxX family protein [Microbacterium sp. USHLN186]|uniref:DoxX family protein n=1 Tax=Microbacterium sp. USHLN186 TaxID=3081286 RepID=UPI00301A8618
MASVPQTITRITLAGLLLFTGVAHLTFARRGFRVAVPDWVPGDPDATVVASGWIEIALGAALLLARRRRRGVGRLVALFFVAVFPGNVSQWTHHRNAPGLDTEMKRFGRLFLQPVLVLLALRSTRD